MHVVELDETTCGIAADLAELTGARTLDALHLAAANRAGKGALTLLTFDIRQAQAARAVGLTVVGV
jgi:predicted nucleic acid-binding protein